MEAKLEPYRLDTIKWGLATIRDFAAEQDADVIVVLMPLVSDPRAQEAPFAHMHEFARQLNLPTIDLLDTFAGIEDLLPYKTSPGDTHPSDLGHQRLFEKLVPRLRQDPRAWGILTGSAAGDSTGY
jgi:hypothetical protein